jgi:putative RecB family exonuclease
VTTARRVRARVGKDGYSVVEVPVPSKRTLSVKLDSELPAPTGLSPTSASTWQHCELKYALTYVLGWQESATIPQLVGNTAHRAIELLYGLAPIERTRGAASELLEFAYVEEVGRENVAGLVEHVTTLREQVMTTGHDALDGLFELEKPELISVGPEGLEVWVRAELYGAPIRGRIDRIYDSSGAHVIADYKSGRTPRSAYTAKAFFGLWTYAAALAASDPNGLLPDRIELLYLIGRERLARPVLREVAIAQARTLATIWREVLAAVNQNEVTAKTGPLCNWCAFQQACPAQVRGALPSVGGGEHDVLLGDLGLKRRERTQVAQALERATSRAEDAGVSEDEP